MVALYFKWFFISLLSLSSLLHSSDSSVPSEKRHPFYVSVTEINHNAKEKTLESSCKIFADEMEDVLKQNYQANVDVGNEKQEPQNGRLINDYIQHHLGLSVDGKPVPLHFVGFEKQSESLYCY